MSGDSPCSVVVYEAKPASPILRKTRLQGRAPNLLGPKRSILAGLVKFLAVGCGLNEVSPKANIELIILADSMAVYLKPQACSWF